MSVKSITRNSSYGYDSGSEEYKRVKVDSDGVLDTV